MSTFKPGERYDKFMAKQKKMKAKGGLRPSSAVVASEQKASHQYYKKDVKPAKKFKKAKKMTQAEDNAYDKKHNQVEGSKKDIAQDKRNGIKDKKVKKGGKKMKKACSKKTEKK